MDSSRHISFAKDILFLHKEIEDTVNSTAVNFEHFTGRVSFQNALFYALSYNFLLYRDVIAIGQVQFLA